MGNCSAKNKESTLAQVAETDPQTNNKKNEQSAENKKDDQSTGQKGADSNKPRNSQPEGKETKTKVLTDNDVEGTSIDKNFEEKFSYDKGQELGSGGYGTVYKGIDKASNNSIAVKVVLKNPDLDLSQLMREVGITKKLDHPHIVKCLGFFEDKDKYYIVNELMSGGELFDRIIELKSYSEESARILCHILLDAMNYCHAMNVVHRDLKPENILLATPQDDNSIKITDFGLAKLASGGLVTTCGSPEYIAPEILKNEQYSTKCDCWSLGVIFYILLTGCPPFPMTGNTQLLLRRIIKGDYSFPSALWDNISTDARDLVKNLMTMDPYKRYSCEQALSSPFIVNGQNTASILDTVTVNMKEFNAKRRLKKAGDAVRMIIAAKKMAIDRKASENTEVVIVPDEEELAKEPTIKEGEGEGETTSEKVENTDLKEEGEKKDPSIAE